MTLKVIGVIFVLVSTGIAGFYYGNIETYRLSDLLEFKRALTILNSEIEFAITPLPEAFRNVAARVKNPVSKIFERMEYLIQEVESENIATLWRMSVTKYTDTTYFSKEDIEQIIVFGKTLGYLDKDMQLHSIEILIGYIDEKIDMLNKTRFTNKKMYRSLGILSGILIVIIFI